MRDLPTATCRAGPDHGGGTAAHSGLVPVVWAGEGRRQTQVLALFCVCFPVNALPPVLQPLGGDSVQVEVGSRGFVISARFL